MLLSCLFAGVLSRIVAVGVVGADKSTERGLLDVYSGEAERGKVVDGWVGGSTRGVVRRHGVTAERRANGVDTSLFGWRADC